MPLQMPTQPNSKQFKHFDYAPTLNTNPVFHCKKIESNEIGVRVVEKSSQDLDSSKYNLNSVVHLNLISGRVTQANGAIVIDQKGGSKTKPTSAGGYQSKRQSSISQRVKSAKTNQSNSKPVASPSIKELRHDSNQKTSSIDKPLQVRPSDGGEGLKRRPQSSNTSKTREHHRNLLGSVKSQKHRMFHSNKKQPKMFTPNDSQKHLQKSVSTQNFSHDHPVQLRNSGQESESQLPRQLFAQVMGGTHKLSTINHTKQSFSDELTTMNLMTMDQNLKSYQDLPTPKLNLMSQLLQSRPMLHSQKRGNPATTAGKKRQTQKGTLSSHGLSSNEGSNEKRKFYTHDNKENKQVDSNQKNRTRLEEDSCNMPIRFRGDLPKALSHTPSAQILLSTDIINKLKQELSKQVKKRPDSKTTRKAVQIDAKQSKHLTSVIPFEQKLKMRQLKMEKQQQQDQEVKRQSEQEEQRRRKELLKFKRDQERKENLAVFDVLKSQGIPTQMSLISRKRSLKRSSDVREAMNKRDFEELDNIVTKQRRVKQDSGVRTPIKSAKDIEVDKASREESFDREYETVDVLQPINLEVPNQIVVSQLPVSSQGMKRANSAKVLNRGSSTSSSRAKNLPLQQRKANFMEFKQFYQTKQENYDSDTETRHQNLENFVKEQKAKRLKNKAQQEQEQTKKLTKIKSQLINLQQDYFKGLNDFKQRQVQQQQALNALKSQERKKSKKSKRKFKKNKLLTLIDKQKQAVASPLKRTQKINYNLALQRNSMPVLKQQFTSTPNMQQRASFQSPVQKNTLEYPQPIGQGLFTDEIITSTQSPSSVGSSNKKNYMQRDSLVSQYSIPVQHQPQYSNGPIAQVPYLPPTQLRFNQTQDQDEQLMPYQLTVYNQQRNTQQALYKTQSFQSMPQKQSFHQQQVKSGSLERQSSVERLDKSQKMQKGQMIDLKSEKSHKMFEQFSKIRKELEKQLKFEDKAIQPQIKKKVAKKPKHFLQQQKAIAKQKQARADQLPLQYQPKVQVQQENLSGSQVSVDQENRIRNQVILDKLQEVAERMQNHFKQQKVPNQLKSSQQTLMLSHTNIIKEEESKDDTITYDRRSKKQSPQHNDNFEQRTPALNSHEVSKIAKNNEREINLPEDQNNTTFLLKKMYEERDTVVQAPEDKSGGSFIQALEKYIITIQKHYRGYVCRRVLREKMRIDKEFRMLRQKYEVKSQFSGQLYGSTPGSLAFSQSQPKFIAEPKTLTQSFQPDPLTQTFVQESPIESVKSVPFYNQSDLLYQQNRVQGDSTEGKDFIAKFSILKSPSIIGDDATQEKQVQNEGLVFEYVPKKLQFQTNEREKLDFYQTEQQPILSEDHNGSFVNEDSERSQLPIEENNELTPLAQETKVSPQIEEVKEQKQNPLTVREDFREQIIDSDKEGGSLQSQNEHRDYLDSPLKLKDLSEDKIDPHQVGIQVYKKSPNHNKNKLKRILPRPINSSQDRQQANQVKPRGLSPIGGGSPRNLLFQQKSSFDMSSLINYGEEHKGEFTNVPDNSKREEEKAPYIKIHTGHEGSNFSDGSPIVIEDDGSPQNQHHDHQKKDHSVSHNTSIFEKNSFQQFAKDKINKVFKAESELENMIEDLNKALKKKIKIREQELNDQQLSVRTYNRKKLELEKWVEKEKREIKMTKKHFTQGCLRLSSLLDTLVKEQNRMKDAVSSIRKQNTSGVISTSALGQVRKSHSFDSELLPKQLSESFSGHAEANTVNEGRRESSEYFSEALKSGDENSIRPLYGVSNEETKKLFDYVPGSSGVVSGRGMPTTAPKQSESEDEELIEVRAYDGEMRKGRSEERNMESMKILVEEIKRREQAISDSKDESPHKSQQSKNSFIEIPDFKSQISRNEGLIDLTGQAPKLPSGSSTPDANLSITQGPQNISDTPIYKDQIKFPEEALRSMEDLEKEQNLQQSLYVNQLVEEILQGILLRDISQRLFPPRPLGKLLSQQLHQQMMQQEHKSPSIKLEDPNTQETIESWEEHKEVERAIEDQIKVLDNILEELAPPEEQSRTIDSPEAVCDIGPAPNQPTKIDTFSSAQESNTEPERTSMSPKSPTLERFSQEAIKEAAVKTIGSEEKKQRRGIETSMLQVNTYMHEIFERLKVDKPQMHSVLENVSQPLYKDPLMILAHLQNSIPEPPQTSDSNESQAQAPNPFESAIPFQQSVLSVDLYLEIEKEKRGGLSISQMRDSFQEDNSQSFVAEMENIHNKAIFDAVNEALDGFRPYGLRGPPLPWSKSNKTLTFKFGKEETFDYLLQKVKYKVLDWAHVAAGTMGRPTTQREKDHLELIREERLARILIQEAEENEQLWTDYEYEETQTKIDTADIILEHLCKEVTDILTSLKERKFEELP